MIFKRDQLALVMDLGWAHTVLVMAMATVYMVMDMALAMVMA